MGILNGGKISGQGDTAGSCSIGEMDLLSDKELFRTPLQRVRQQLETVLRDVAEGLVSPGAITVSTRFVLQDLARIPPGKLHPSAVVSVLDSKLGPNDRRSQLLEEQQAAEQLISEAVARGIQKLLHQPADAVTAPDTSEWKDLFSLVAFKRAYCLLSPAETAMYTSLSIFWYGGDLFRGVPQLVPLTAKLALARDIENSDERKQAMSSLGLEISLCLMAPNDDDLRAMLKRADGDANKMTNRERKFLEQRWKSASVSLPQGVLEALSIRWVSSHFPGLEGQQGFKSLANSLFESWPSPQRESPSAILTCLKKRAVIAVQALELYNFDERFLDSLSSLEQLGDIVLHTAAWTGGALRPFFPKEVWDQRKSETISHGIVATSGAARDERVCLLQEKLVEQYIDFYATGDPRAFSTDTELAAEHQLSDAQVDRYLRSMRRAPWLARILDIRNRAPTPQDMPREPLPKNQGPRHAPMILSASGCRYRDEFFDSQSEATVGILLERYLPSFQIKRGVSFQVPIDGKRIDFCLGEVSGSPIYLEYHPIILGRPGFRHDFDSDEEAARFYASYAAAPPQERANLAKHTKEALSQRYADTRRSLALSLDPDAILHHVEDAGTLYDLMLKTHQSIALPPREAFEWEFHALVKALGELHFAESLLDEALASDFPSSYERDWNSAPSDVVSRPVQPAFQRQRDYSPPLPVVTSFAHRSAHRVVEVTVPRLFDPSLQVGRHDDHLYASVEDFTQGLEKLGISAVTVASDSINVATVPRIARDIVSFLCNRELAPEARPVPAPSLGADLLPLCWIGEPFESLARNTYL